MHYFRNSLLGYINLQISLLGSRILIHIINTREPLDLTRPRLGIQPLLVRPLTVFQRSSDVNEEKVASGATGGLDRRFGGFSRVDVGCGWGGDDGCSGAGEFGGDESDSLNVFVSVFGGEAEFCIMVVWVSDDTKGEAIWESS